MQEDLSKSICRTHCRWPNRKQIWPRAVTEAQFARTPENQFLEVVYRSGKKDVLYRGDLASGAIIAAIVERAKSLAIKRSIQTRQETHLTREDLIQAMQRGVCGERSVPAHGHHGRLDEADRFRSGQRDPARPGAPAQTGCAGRRHRLMQGARACCRVGWHDITDELTTRCRGWPKAMTPPIIQFGLETEIGISREDDDELDVVAESIALVRSATEPGVWMRWDYESEDPHADMRGFRVSELRQDSDEANYFAQDAQRELSFVEIKSDLVLGNGARFYNDHAHPEYCTPECSTLGRTGRCTIAPANES